MPCINRGGWYLCWERRASTPKFLNTLKKLREANHSIRSLLKQKSSRSPLITPTKTGINWSQLGGDMHVAAPLGALSFPHGAPGSQRCFYLAVEHEKFSVVLNLVKKFGTVRTLSNPRLTVMNNQPAMLKVATNEVFFTWNSNGFFKQKASQILRIYQV